jgi:hypothetical protein
MCLLKVEVNSSGKNWTNFWVGRSKIKVPHKSDSGAKGRHKNSV